MAILTPDEFKKRYPNQPTGSGTILTPEQFKARYSTAKPKTTLADKVRGAADFVKRDIQMDTGTEEIYGGGLSLSTLGKALFSGTIGSKGVGGMVAGAGTNIYGALPGVDGGTGPTLKDATVVKMGAANSAEQARQYLVNARTYEKTNPKMAQKFRDAASELQVRALEDSLRADELIGRTQTPQQAIEATLNTALNALTFGRASVSQVIPGAAKVSRAITPLASGASDINKGIAATRLGGRIAEQAAIGTAYQGASNIGEGRPLTENMGTAAIIGGAIPVVGTIARKVVSGTPQALISNAQRMYQSAMKPTGDLATRQRVVNTGLREGIVLSEGGIEKTMARIDALEEQIGHAIDAAGAQGKSIPTGFLKSFVDDAKKFFENISDVEYAAKAVSDIDAIYNNFVAKYGDSVPVNVAQEIKIATYQWLKNSFGELAGPVKEGNKQLVRGLKEGIAENAPVMGKINERLKALYEFDVALEKSQGRIKNTNLLGLGTKILASSGNKVGMILALGNQLMGSFGNKSRLAIYLYRFGRAMELLSPYERSQVFFANPALKNIWARVFGNQPLAPGQLKGTGVSAPQTPSAMSRFPTGPTSQIPSAIPATGGTSQIPPFAPTVLPPTPAPRPTPLGGLDAQGRRIDAAGNLIVPEQPANAAQFGPAASGPVGVNPETGQFKKTFTSDFADQKKNISEQAGGKAAMGGFAGIETDEEGNVTFNKEKAALGIGGMFVGQKAKNWSKLGNKFVGPIDKKMRAEISDDLAKVARLGSTQWNKLNRGDSVPMGDFLEHSRLYDEYPDLKDVVLSVDKSLKGGAYTTTDVYGNNPKIFVTQFEDGDKFKSTLLHELQHVIQVKEAFAQGGSSKGILAIVADKIGVPTYKNERGRTSVSVPVFKEMLQKKVDQIDEVLGRSNGMSRQEKLDFLREAGYEPRQFYADSISILEHPYSKKSFQLYKKLAGEVESRNVQTRMNFTPEERIAKPPMSTQDVPVNQQIYRKQKLQVQQMSEPAPSRRRIGTTGRYIGSPGLTTPQQISGLAQKLTNLAKKGIAGKDWYKKGAQHLMEALPNKEDQKAFAKLLAIFSPNTAPGENYMKAARAFLRYKEGLPIKAGGLTSGDVAAENVLRGGQEISGEKVSSFYQNILKYIDPASANTEAVTNDIWMQRAFGYGKKSSGLATQQHAFMTKTVQRVAKNLGISPDEAQAAIWVAVREGDSATNRVILEGGSDFGKAAEKLYSRISWEAAPSKTSGLFPEFFSAPYEQRMLYHAKVENALLDENGRNAIFDLVGLPQMKSVRAPGVFEGEVSPGTQWTVEVPKRSKSDKLHTIKSGETFESIAREYNLSPNELKGFYDKEALSVGDKIFIPPMIDPVAYKKLQLAASLMGKLTNQDSVAFGKLYPASTLKNANSALIDLGRTFSTEEAKVLDQAMEKAFGPYGYSIPGDRDGFIVLNFSKLTDKKFRNILEKVIDEVFPGNIAVGIKYTVNHGELVGKLPHEYGTNYSKSFAEGSQTLQGGREVLQRIQERLEAVNKETGAKYGWTDSRTEKVNIDDIVGRKPTALGDVELNNDRTLALSDKRVTSERNSRSVNKALFGERVSKGTRELFGKEIEAQIDEFGGVFRPGADIVTYPEGRVFSDLTKENGELWLSEFAVSKPSQKMGLGKRYWDTVRQYADKTGTPINVYKIVDSSKGFWKKIFPDAKWGEYDDSFKYVPKVGQ